MSIKKVKIVQNTKKVSIISPMQTMLSYKNKFLHQMLLMVICSSSLFGQITRTQIMTNADPYINYDWTATSGNIWNNINCSSVGNITTPSWVKVGSNTAMPYCWGGWSSLTSFAKGVSNGESAGDNDCSTSGDIDGTCAVGVDCSGFVTKAWGITSQKYSTTTLPNISTKITLSQVQKGDIVDNVGSHVRLVDSINANGSVTVLESSGKDWKVSPGTYTPAQLTSYTPFKYNNVSLAHVTFQVHMGVQMLTGAFNPPVDSVVIRGTFQTLAGDTVTWARNKFVMGPTKANDSIYTLTVAFPDSGIGDTIQYKYVIHTNADTRESMTNNRAYAITSGATQVIPLVYFNNQTTAIRENPNVVKLPKNYSLNQNYPDPFNPTTAIIYDLPKAGHVTLNVYDILGRQVALLVNENKNPGEYKVTLDASRLASGVYFYRIDALSNDGQRFVSMKKLVLLK